MNKKLFGRGAAKKNAVAEPEQILIQPDGTTIPIVPAASEPDDTVEEAAAYSLQDPVSDLAVPEGKPEKKNAKRSERKKKKGAQKRTLGVRKGLTALQKGIIIAASILGVFLIAAVVMYFSSGAGKKVYVVSVGEITQYNYFMNESNSYGTVKAENLQAQYVTESQHVNEILVKEGDRVRTGDLVMTYDPTPWPV